VRASTPELNVNLQINASWGGGDILNLNIVDLDTGERQQVAIRLSEFINEGENVPYILLQAMDLLGERQSGVIQIENPLFDPDLASNTQSIGNSGSAVGVDELPSNLQNIVAEANEPTPPQTLTPDGTGTVVDNIMTVNDIEFFTVTTDSGSDFFLVVDRQRTSNNVYLLNTVTESDLMALAEARGETLTSSNNISAAQPPVSNEPQAPSMEEILQAIQESNDQNEASQVPVSQGGNSGLLVLALIVVLLGGSGFATWRWLLPMVKNIGQGNQETIEDDGSFYGDEYGDEGEYSDETDYSNFEVDDVGSDENEQNEESYVVEATETTENRGDADEEE